MYFRFKATVEYILVMTFDICYISQFKHVKPF